MIWVFLFLYNPVPIIACWLSVALPLPAQAVRVAVVRRLAL
jgi:hypothetical protein